jgi:hypothetical protein
VSSSSSVPDHLVVVNIFVSSGETEFSNIFFVQIIFIGIVGTGIVSFTEHVRNVFEIFITILIFVSGVVR